MRAPGAGRGVELGLLVFATGSATLALVLVETAQQHQLSRSLMYLGAGYLGVFGVAHAAVRRWVPYAARPRLAKSATTSSSASPKPNPITGSVKPKA